jgi:uncharacterized protein HemY
MGMTLANTDNRFMMIILAVIVAMVLWYVLYRFLTPICEKYFRWRSKK